MYLCYYAGQLTQNPNTGIDFLPISFKTFHWFKYPMNFSTNIKARGFS